jgi:hypothetical protein
MDLCTSSTSPGSCGHRIITIGDRTLHMHENEIVPLSDDEKDTLFRLAVRHKGVALAQLLNRVISGDEATNVKIYPFFGPGAAITKTNIGTTYVNICPGVNGERLIADFTGCTQYRLMLHANLIGTGQWGARVVRDGDNVVLHENANLGAAGERELDTDWQALPAAFLGQGLIALRAQGKSTTAADDPVFRSLRVGLR